MMEALSRLTEAHAALVAASEMLASLRGVQDITHEQSEIASRLADEVVGLSTKVQRYTLYVTHHHAEGLKRQGMTLP